MKTPLSIVLFTLALLPCSAAPGLLRVPLEELKVLCLPVLEKKTASSSDMTARKAKVAFNSVDRSFALLDSFRMAANHHAKRGMPEKVEGYCKKAIEQLADFESQFAAFEKNVTSADIGLDQTKLGLALNRVHEDTRAYRMLLEKGKFPEEQHKQQN